MTKYLLGEFGAVLAVAAAITGWLFWRLDRKHPALGISNLTLDPRAATVSGEAIRL